MNPLQTTDENKSKIRQFYSLQVFIQFFFGCPNRLWLYAINVVQNYYFRTILKLEYVYFIRSHIEHLIVLI